MGKGMFCSSGQGRLARRSLHRAALIGAAALLSASAASAQVPIGASTQFDITGFLEEATVNNIADPLSGGTLRVNGHTITVPSNTILMLPANALTWQELFTHAPAPYNALNETGLALADLPAPLVGAEVHVQGNRVLPDANHATDQYIAGLVFFSQQSLNAGAGFINFIDYTLGELRVGGLLNDPNCVQGVVNPLCSGARVRINDPVGRFGRNTTSPDTRFCVDDANPTIIAGTGYPMCLPRTDPAVVDDPLCPQGNRPRDVAGNFAATINMPDPALIDNGTLPVFPDPRIQAPFEVGDYITFSGTLVVDAVPAGFGPTEGPYPSPASGGTDNTYIAAHTITNNVAIYTAPGKDPAYVMADTMLIGTGGLTVLGAGEATIRTRFEGMTTDPSRNIHLYGVDYNPADGSTTDRDFGTIGVDQGPAAGGAVQGRWRFRPPCLPFGSVPTKPDKQCVYNLTGTFLPPPRELRAVIEGQQTQVPISPASLTAANGIVYGQYHAPIFEYIFPENIPGTPVVENNFNSIQFLAQGGYSSSTGVLAGVLNPWPSNVLPAAACSAPVASAGGPYAVASGGTLTLTGSASGTTPITFAWTADAGTFVDPTLANAVFNAPAGPATANLTLTATNACGTSTSATTVTVNVPTAPAVVVGPSSTVTAGTPVTLTATLAGATSFTFTQTGAAGAPLVLNPNPTTVPTATGTATITLNTSFVLAAPATLTFSVTGSVGGVDTPAATVSVTLNPTADQITISLAEYRIGKQRLIINATSSNPNAVMTLQPYVTTTGVLFDPATLGSPVLTVQAGIPTLILVGAPEPATPPAAPLVVTSNLGGASPPTALTKIRQ